MFTLRISEESEALGVAHFTDADGSRLYVHDGCNEFAQQDLLVPWNSKTKPTKGSGDTSASVEDKNAQFLRYYHLFVDGELTELVTALPACVLKNVEFEEGNWIVMFEKI